MGSLKDRLTIAIDIGTTQTAVAVRYVPKDGPIFSTIVDAWPGQEDDVQLARVPTALLYSVDGNLIACGAKVQQELQRILQIDGTARHIVPQHFKMQLHSKESSVKLDENKSIPITRLYADYLRFLLNHTRSHLTGYCGFDPWVLTRNDATIVFSHPNKWNSEQQLILRQAAIAAGLVSPRDVTSRLHFVEEAEAAASFALMTEPEVKNLLRVGTKFIVCDAGGSTIDISSYVVKSPKSRKQTFFEVEELAPSFSLDAGGVYVDMEFSSYFSDILTPVLGGDPEELQTTIDDALADFEGQSKRRFAGPADIMQVKCGPLRQQISGIGIHQGVLEVPSEFATGFFQRSIETTANNLLSLKRTHQVSVIIFTGGFADNLYFQRVIKARSKAVAVGALSLASGLEQSIRIKRAQRSWTTWLMDIFRR
ncbi:hypothetical protein DL93DRAFT_590002 [Clavulina sp. PMI_390]|nr:hypothetical protein DL93DRAFT_590002 [Clavulina sp. PMI_390]